jgi:hypothetical protein
MKAISGYNRRKKRQQASRRWYAKHGGASQAAWRKRNRQKLRLYLRAYNWRRKGFPTPTRPMPAICECCRRPPNGKGVLHLDHDHATGAFRGWLCYSCNQGIGLLGDTARKVAHAVAYLLRAARA